MTVPVALSDARKVANLSDRAWRLNNLYRIEDKYGRVVLFQLNEAQTTLLDELHYLNIVLKARQMGFSTFILILALDCCLFNKHFNAGLIADTLDNAKNLLKRVKFAYDRLEPELTGVVALITDNATELEFSNGSGISVGVSLRSGTFNFLHISEYGKICAKAPEKAKEIRSGSLNTLAPEQLCFIESTAEGRAGDFYDKSQDALKIRDSGREPKTLEYKAHFFPWFMDQTYTSEDPIGLTEEDRNYFRGLKEEHGIELTEGQEWWYAAKSREQQEDMWKEFPSTPEEAFRAAKEGSYFGKQIKALRQRGLVGALPMDPRSPVHTAWDLGISDSTTIWLFQVLAGRYRFIGYHENSGEGMDYYTSWLDKWRARHGATFGRHLGPHDIDQRRPGATLFTIKFEAQKLGYLFETVTRNPVKQNAIENARKRLPECEFDELACTDGLLHLEEYAKEWDEKLGTWKSSPRHDEHSHGADAFMTFADGFIPMKKSTHKHKRRVVA